MYDAIVVGGGFYGANIAHYLTTARGLSRVLLLDREGRLMTRASFANQARVHGGYHYLRSFTTAYRSRLNRPRFCREFAPAVFDGFTNLYAVARRNSKVTRRQMERFCHEIGAPLAPAPAELARLFDPALVEASYVTAEQAFDADILRGIMERRLAEAGVEIALGHEVEAIEETPGGLAVAGRAGEAGFRFEAATVFNCTYARLQATAHGLGAANFHLRHEIAEMALVEAPPALAGLGVTVMDGAFFSLMPFPARPGLHSLSHVRYTPHLRWAEDEGVDPYRRLEAYPQASGVDWMMRDAARYLPALARAVPRSTLFEVKTVLANNDADDGRPILCQRHGPGGRVFSILGGKIDNIYDILQRLDAEQLVGEGARA